MNKDRVLIYFLSVLIGCIGILQVYTTIKLRQVSLENQKLNFLLYNPSGIMPDSHKATLIPHMVLQDIHTRKEMGIYEGVKNPHVLIFAFSTECFSCDQSAALWNQVYEKYGKSIAVRGVSSGGPTAIEKYVARNNVKFPVYHYDGQPGLDIFTSLPQTILTDQNGGIVLSMDGIPYNIINQMKEVLR